MLSHFDVQDREWPAQSLKLIPPQDLQDKLYGHCEMDFIAYKP